MSPEARQAEFDRVAAGMRLYIAAVLPNNVHARDALSHMIDQLASMIPAGVLAEEARDSARYRWLRRHSYIHAVGSLNFGGGCWQTMPELLDEAIDALSAPTQTPPCRGTACGTTTGEHSAECVAEHARAVAGLPRA